MKLKTLFKNLSVRIIGNKDLAITGLTAHSKKVAPGNLFIAKKGISGHGSDFIAEALFGGAKAVLTDLYNPFCKEATQIIHPHPEELEGILADRFYDHPSSKLMMIGITGTNGKTTTAYLARQLIGERVCAMIGTIEYLVGGNSYISAEHTTPDVITNHKLLSMAYENHLRFCLMEVTSHGLEQRRTDAIPFRIACFTNLSEEHLDYHQTIETYAVAKTKLFDSLTEKSIAVFNRDDPYSEKMVEGCPAGRKTYGLSREADVFAGNVEFSPSGTTFDLNVEGEKQTVKMPLVGIHNLYNTLAAVTIALVAGIPLRTVRERIQFLKAPKGRLQPVANRTGMQIFVDFAHSEDAIRHVLKALHPLKRKRIITVFGCGGDRDRGKRAKMGRAVSLLSDVTIITSDNPRNEKPEEICREIRGGCVEGSGGIHICPDRYEAIEMAIEIGKKGDIILVAGRGHETFQIFSGRKIPFNDAEVIQKILEKKRPRRELNARPVA